MRRPPSPAPSERCSDGGEAARPAPLLVPSPTVAEVCCHLGEHAAAQVEASLLRSLADGQFVPVELVECDDRRMAELVLKYADLPLGGSDAAVIAVAERLRVTTVATIDNRGFHTVQPRHVPYFTLLPH
ncbi:PIN domain-containing protein [Thermocrispum sp.]|uniref:PIN domain-containing protein n=1 Tax=Thermocrispum agreste TaxID=37925 RepID=A0ABD6FHE8_9PSEU|nr:PIN domain-containing protein [Thermocrispum sp.]